MHSIRWCACTVLIAGLLGVGMSAGAHEYTEDIDNSQVAGTPIKQPPVVYPGSAVRTRQEGWVRVSFVIAPDGSVNDPIVIDSMGGVDFEQSAREAIAGWRFEPPPEALANNTVDIKFSFSGNRALQSRNFVRRYRRIMEDILAEDVAKARDGIDEAIATRRWNLYESTMLELMLGRISGLEGDQAGKLEHYRRALEIGHDRALSGSDKRELLIKVFELQLEHGQHGAASATLNRLRDEAGSSGDLAKLEEQVAELDEALAAGEPLRATATLYNPCDCDAGKPVWAYRPARQTFSFDALSGNVKRFEVRCEHDRLQGAVDADTRWTLPEEAGNCRVFVFGDDGARFEFVEHGDGQTEDPAAAPPAVARNDVLDRGN